MCHFAEAFRPRLFEANDEVIVITRACEDDSEDACDSLVVKLSTLLHPCKDSWQLVSSNETFDEAFTRLIHCSNVNLLRELIKTMTEDSVDRLSEFARWLKLSDTLRDQLNCRWFDLKMRVPPYKEVLEKAHHHFDLFCHTMRPYIRLCHLLLVVYKHASCHIERHTLVECILVQLVLKKVHYLHESEDFFSLFQQGVQVDLDEFSSLEKLLSVRVKFR